MSEQELHKRALAERQVWYLDHGLNMNRAGNALMELSIHLANNLER